MIQRLEAEIDGMKSIHYYVIKGNLVVGYAKVELFHDIPLLNGLFVEESYRGRGLGALLLHSVLENPHLMLFVKDGNPARKMYELKGFEECEENHYDGYATMLRDVR